MNKWTELEAIYAKAVSVLGEMPREQAASSIDLDRFEELLRNTSADESSIFRHECLSIAGELRGDLSAAVNHRRIAVSLINRLLESAAEAGNSSAVAEAYDYSDLVDQMDLLAILLYDAGMLDDAITVLSESNAICESHKLEFSGAELLRSYQTRRIAQMQASVESAKEISAPSTRIAGPARRWTHESVKQIMSFGDPIDYITSRARQVALAAIQNGWSGPPFSPFELAGLLKIATVPRDSIRDGRLVPLADGNVQIEYNPNYPRSRIFFTVAHEIAHTLFPDFAAQVRNRASRQEMSADDFQFEMLCNLGASELLMPVGSFLREIEQSELDTSTLVSLAAKFNASVEAVILRTIRLTDKPCAMFSASVHGERSLGYRVDYSLSSKAWDYALPPGTVVPSDSVVRHCVANLFTASATERWPGASEPVRVESIGVVPYPGQVSARVLGLLLPATQTQSMPVNKIRYQLGDASLPVGAGKKVIVHVVNDKARRWGRGFAGSLARKWPHVHEDYSQWFTSRPRKLGDTHIASAEGDIAVASVVAQHGYGPAVRNRLEYQALESSLGSVGQYSVDVHASVHMPRIGTGQAGGQWSVVSELVDEVLCRSGVRVTVYDLPNRKVSGVATQRTLLP
jgi:Zn-dependent peptidase ImmA (M78 family)/O-acetyl-ADP-ribose deacetylase (regulator of RNase III)